MRFVKVMYTRVLEITQRLYHIVYNYPDNISKNTRQILYIQCNSKTACCTKCLKVYLTQLHCMHLIQLVS